MPLACIALFALVVGTSAVEAAPAKALGDAYRAYVGGDYAKASRIARSVNPAALRNPDYLLFVRAQSDFVGGKPKRALADFERLGLMKNSRFAERARWRIADCLWEMGKTDEAVDAYRRLLANKASRSIDPALARFRLAEAAAKDGRKDAAIAAFRSFRANHPSHPLEPKAADRLREIGGASAVALSNRQRLSRATALTRDKSWAASIAELRRIPDSAPAKLVLERDFWTGMTLFKMRRRYKDAGAILLRIYKKMGPRAAEAMFHGARALSRADLDLEAVTWYQKVVAEYPRSKWAAEAQYLSGWLHFNLGQYRAGIRHLEKMRAKYPRSKWTKTADWYLGFSYFLLDERQKALPYFERIAKQGGKLEGGKGRYWVARTKWLIGKKTEANTEYTVLITRYPFSWYALLARARLARQKIAVSAFGNRPKDAAKRTPAIARTAPAAIRNDPALRDARELIDAGLDAEAGLELRRSEKSFLKRHRRKRAAAIGALMGVYRKASNFNRPWMLAVTRGGRALAGPPVGNARVWWEHAYPRAYRDFVDRHASVGNTPPLYLWSIMRKESGFNPNVRSYANAMGLLQMIPPTTRRVARALKIDYTADLLYDPELNIKTGSWYIGKLLAKFKGQIPYAAGSFNSGPRPIMKWMRKFKGQPADVFGELASYSQTREYMKKVTESYARYVYLYDKKVYDLSLDIDYDYVDDSLTY